MAKWASNEAIFNSPVPREKYEVPGAGLIEIRGLTCGEKDEYEERVIKVSAGGDRRVKMENARAVLMQMTIYDQHGNRKFAERDIGKLRTVPGVIAEPILDIARRLSAMDKNEIKGLVKNSQDRADDGDGCSTDSPQHSEKPDTGSPTM